MFPKAVKEVRACFTEIFQDERSTNGIVDLLVTMTAQYFAIARGFYAYHMDGQMVFKECRNFHRYSLCRIGWVIFQIRGWFTRHRYLYFGLRGRVRHLSKFK